MSLNKLCYLDVQAETELFVLIKLGAEASNITLPDLFCFQALASLYFEYLTNY